jgi:5S rRNA maturation endonuclease (ribonuclease M5)
MQNGYLQATWSWTYTSPTGKPLGHTVRYDGKDRKKVLPYFKQGEAGWTVGAPEAPRVLYGLSTLPKDSTTTVYVVEGEKCAQAMINLGFPAVTSLDGSNGAEHADWTPLKACEHVVILPDNDEPGERYAEAVARLLRAQNPAVRVEVARLKGLLDKGDVVDWIKDSVDAEWDGYGPVPREPGDDLHLELLEAIEETAKPATFEERLPATATVEDEPWEAPLPLKEHHPAPWHDNVFPEAVQAFVNALSAGTETPPELAGTMVLSVLATATQGKCKVRVKEGYEEPLALWTACALPSGNRKSSVLDAAKLPLNTWETRQRQILKPHRDLIATDQEAAKRRIKSLKRKADHDGITPEEAAEISREIQKLEQDQPPLPEYPRLWTNDATPEVLSVLMEKHNGCISILSDEGGPFDIMGGRYSKGHPNLDVYLQAHAGGSIRVDRLNRDSVIIDSASMCIGIAPQPSVLRDLARTPEFRDRGLLARFLPSLPESNLGQRTGNGPPMPTKVAADYEALVHAMLDLELLRRAHTGGNKACEIWLSKDAEELWRTFERQNEADLGPNGRLHHITDWGSKLPGQVARIAAVLHVARCAFTETKPWREDVSGKDMAAAIRMGDYFRAHALRLFALLGADPMNDDAVTVLTWLKRQARDAREETKEGTPEPVFSFSKRDVQRAMQARFHHSSELDAPLDILQDCGYIRERRVPGPRKPGRRSEVYELNPAALDEP